MAAPNYTIGRARTSPPPHDREPPAGSAVRYGVPVDDPTFPALWQSLQLDSVADAIDPGATLTPRSLQSLRHDGDDDTWIRTPSREDPTAVLARLPALPVSEGGDDADLVVQAVLGTGGMGVVHLARQRSLMRDVAVKRLGRSDPALVEGLLREAMVTGSLEHPNIVPVHALGRDRTGDPVLVMKRIEGRKWSDAVRQDLAATGRLDEAAEEKHLRVLLDVCNALQYAHRRGVVHRDVKLGNVMIGEFGEVYLVDWGIAAPVGTRPTGNVVGTPGYMAPEMVDGGPVTERTDVYLLGATLHHLLVGRSRHFGGKGVYDVLRSAFESAPYAYGAGIPAELAAICNRAMARDPADRFESALAFQSALEAYLKHRGSSRMARNAALRMEELFALLDVRGDERRVADAISAVRFGLRQALEAWPENEAARADLVRTMERTVPWALDHGDPNGAAEQLADLLKHAADPHRHADLAERVGHAVRKHEALVRLGEQLDLAASGPQRVRFLAAMWVVASIFGVGLILAVRAGIVPVSHAGGVWVAGGAVVGLQVGVLAAWRRLLLNIADQRILFSVILLGWGVLLHRLYGWFLGIDPHAVYATDLLLLAIGATMLGIAVSRRILAVAVLLALAGLVASVFPAFAVEIIAVTLSLSCLALVALFWEWAR
jgi:hypothetical protein